MEGGDMPGRAPARRALQRFAAALLAATFAAGLVAGGRLGAYIYRISIPIFSHQIPKQNIRDVDVSYADIASRTIWNNTEFQKHQKLVELQQKISIE